MPTKTEEELFRAFKNQQERVREEAKSQGKTEVTQQEYDSSPLIRLQKIYERWSNRSLFHAKEEYSSLLDELAEIKYSFFEFQRFHETHKNSSLEYALFMCAAGSSLKSGDGSQAQGTELNLFLKSERLLPLLLYLKEKSHKAQVKIEGLDTVVLTEYEWAHFHEYDVPSGTLVIDCKVGQVTDIGGRMKSGTIKLTEKVKSFSVGWGMQGGTIIYDGDLTDVRVGEGMEGGLIEIRGKVIGSSDIGREMKGGIIRVKRDYTCFVGTGYLGGSVGYGMLGGEIRLEGDFVGSGSLGCYMSGGTVAVQGYVKGNGISVGTHNKGHAKVHVNGDCVVQEVGCLMEGGTINIGGRAGVSIASNMKDGEIYIGGKVHQSDENHSYPIGSRMTGGTVTLGGDVEDVSNDLFGGTIKIGGTFIYKDYFIKSKELNGKVYERGVLVEPLGGFRLIGKIIRELFK